MGLLIKVILALVGAGTTLAVAFDATNFGVVQGMAGLVLVAALVAAPALFQR